MLPSFLIIGAQKSGSTFFLKCLGDHPDVFMPPGEVRFFEDPEYSPDALHKLENLFRGVPADKTLGIKRPGYLSRSECAERIHRHIPHARLIAVLRNPIDRAVSAYFHLIKCGFLPVRSVEDGLARIVEGEYQRRYAKSAEIIDFGFYHRHLVRYLNYFDRRQMLILPFESIRADPLDAVRQAYRFVGVDDGYVPGQLKSNRRPNPNPGVYSLARLRVLGLRNRFMYTYNRERTRRYSKRRPTPVDRAMNRLIESTDRLALARLFGNARPQVSDSLRRRLFELYAEDVHRLEELLGYSLDNWKPGSNERLITTEARRHGVKPV